MGYAKELVHLMQGSLDDWMALGGPIDKAPAKAIEADILDLDKKPDYVATDPQNVVNLVEMKEIVDGNSAIVIDVRARNRFLDRWKSRSPACNWDTCRVLSSCRSPICWYLILPLSSQNEKWLCLYKKRGLISIPTSASLSHAAVGSLHA